MKFLFGLTLLLSSAVSQATPDFVSTERFDLDAYRGQVVYLDFWASWCVPCRLSFPWLIATQAQYAAQGLNVIAINVDSETAEAEAFLRGHATNFPIVLDPQGEIADSYAIQGMPSSVLIGRDGQVLQRHTGFREKDISSLENAIAAALAQGHKQP